MATIDLTITNLQQSTQSRSGTPDGNIFFDVANGVIEIIDSTEVPTMAGAVPNELDAADGITLRALYAFERQERRTDETLRQYDYFFRGSFKFAGAYEIVNGRKFATNGSPITDDREKVRSSGWVERATVANGEAVDRIYFGVRSLGNIEAASQPYYQLSAGGAPVDFAKAGPVNEAVQVYGVSTYDAGAGDFDTRTYLAVSVRTFGQNYDRKTLTDSGITEMGGYSAGFALGESAHLTTGSYALADVYTTPIAPWTGTGLEELTVPQTETGFTQADGDFTYVINNIAGTPATLDEVVAFLDAIAQTDNDIDDGTGTINGKRVSTWYSYDAQGRIVTAQGLFIESLPTSDHQRVVFTDDAGALKTYPFQVQVSVTVGPNAAADTNAWYHCYFADGPGAGDDFNTSGAITVQDSTPADVKGSVSAATVITFTFDYDGDTLGGTAGTDKDVIFECEGDGVATQAKTPFTITRAALVTATAAPGLETNT
jgi:YD repeat-containing protein